MNNRIRLLYAPADGEALSPILDALRARSLRIDQTAPDKSAVTLAVLSRAFYADEEKTGRLLELLAAGAENVLPLQLDDEPIPDRLMHPLYARNIIRAADRDASLLAERIAAALPQKKRRGSLYLIAAAAVLVLIGGFLVWRSAQKKAAVPAMAEQEVYIPAAYGLTQADLDKIEAVAFVGDRFVFVTPDYVGDGPLATNGMEDDGMHWYSTEDGHRLSLRHFEAEDLEFLKLMPNLKGIELVLADVEALPDLSGLPCLDYVLLADCTVTDISGLAGSSLEAFYLYRCPIADYSPLSACEKLTDTVMEFEFIQEADLSVFAPPALERAEFRHGPSLRALDLSGLASCPRLQSLRLAFGLPVRELSFLRSAAALEELVLEELPVLGDLSALDGCESLRKLEVRDCPGVSVLPKTDGLTELTLFQVDSLRDASALRTMTDLLSLTVQDCPQLLDLTPIAGCESLTHIHIQGQRQLRDASFLAGLGHLASVELFDAPLRDLEFLSGLGENAPSPPEEGFAFSFSGDIEDYAGLAYIKKYRHLHVHPQYDQGDRGGDFAAVFPFLEDAEVGFLTLYGCRGVDLSRLPNVTRELSIHFGDLEDLRGLQELGLETLYLEDMPYLRSLDGIEALKKGPFDAKLGLTVKNCPRLTDWSAVEQAQLSSLTLEGVSTLPVFDEMDVHSLSLAHIEGLTDLHCLDGLTDLHSYPNIRLDGLEELRDLSALRRFEIKNLSIPPQLAEQAKELVELGGVESYEVVYPDGSWQPLDGPATLLSLSELDTLPKAFLRQVEWLTLTGEDEPEEESAVAGVLTQLDCLVVLTGLRGLTLRAQPLETLDGIQELEALERLSLWSCDALTDISAAFACPSIRSLEVCDCPAESLRGIRNLTELRELTLMDDPNLTDLTPLLELDSLETVRLSADMEAAIRSLDGLEYGFALEIIE